MNWQNVFLERGSRQPDTQASNDDKYLIALSWGLALWHLIRQGTVKLYTLSFVASR